MAVDAWKCKDWTGRERKGMATLSSQGREGIGSKRCGLAVKALRGTAPNGSERIGCLG